MLDRLLSKMGKYIFPMTLSTIVTLKIGQGHSHWIEQDTSTDNAFGDMWLLTFSRPRMNNTFMDKNLFIVRTFKILAQTGKATFKYDPCATVGTGSLTH